MIDHLRIKNFKCWEDTGEITLSPITVFFGENSAGKSSVGQFLMMLKQSVESSDRKMVFFTGNENTPVDLGVPADVFFEKDTKRHIEFSYDWTPKEEIEINDAIHRDRRRGDHIFYKGEVGLAATTGGFYVEKASYELSTIEDGNIRFSLQKKEYDNGKKSYEILADNYDLLRKQGKSWSITAPVRFYGFPDEAVAYYQNADFIQNLNLLHERLFSSIYYLGPLRNRAKRLYTWAGGEPKDVGRIGDDTISAILAARESGRLLNTEYRKKRKTLEEVVAEMLQKMGLIESFKISKVSEKRQDYEVKVRTKGSKSFVDILDVGVGVSQVLPVIVEVFYAPPGSTIIIEQPELHLHPAAQAGLADVLIDAIHAREDYENRGIQLIIESHSEHFLRRLQRRIAEGELKEEEFSGYFISISDHSKIEKLQIDEYGEIDNWPENFFGDIQGDIFKQTMAGIYQRSRQKA